MDSSGYYCGSSVEMLNSIKLEWKNKSLEMLNLLLEYKAIGRAVEHFKSTKLILVCFNSFPLKYCFELLLRLLQW